VDPASGAANPTSGPAAVERPDAAPRSAPVGPAAETSPGAEPVVGPHDVPGAPFELIAANLQWPFDVGAETADPVDAALLRHAAASARTAALYRTWVEDPAGGWVRVVLGYVNRGSIADVESERTAVVDALQGAGAARCCVEVLAAADASDAHRWLEQRCHQLWPAKPAPDPAPAPDAAPGPDPAAGPDPASTPEPASIPEPGAGPLPADAEFRPGPGADDPAVRPLVAWAQSTPGVVGLVTAYARDRLVVGVALDGDADPDRVRAAAPAPVEPFAPARGLSPVHLRLTRGSTRVWTRRAERAAPEPARPAGGALARPEAPAVAYLGPPPVRDTEEARGDEQVGGFTLVGIDRDTAVGKGDPTPDEPDAALVDWARARTGAIALLRAVTEEGLRVYCVAIEETADPAGTRRDLAAAAAAAGLDRAAVEAFAPAGAISAFHLDLAVGSTRLWPTAR
jgi:hypothetical protein